MPRTRSPFPKDATMADTLNQLGDIPPNRVRMNPLPGTATERDLLAVLDHTNRLCELVDGTWWRNRWASPNPSSPARLSAW